MKYAQWEETEGELERARSVFERGIDVDHRCVTLWLKYSEMEMKNKHVNHARNIWDRAVLILPRINQFWYKYSYMEEMLGNVAGARRVFERWMEWEPEEQAWLSYIKMELRYKEIVNARNIYERFIQIHQETKNWIRYARFEENQENIANARNIFKRAIDFFGEDAIDERLMMAFARFEEAVKNMKELVPYINSLSINYQNLKLKSCLRVTYTLRRNMVTGQALTMLLLTNASFNTKRA